jgi:hypothetical protein
VAPLRPPFWAIFSKEFHCPSCGADDAYHSRPRGFFEAYVLPVFLLQPVRCDRCYMRSYVPRIVRARDRVQPERKQPESQPTHGSNANTRIA